jgi:hypothetical protein
LRCRELLERAAAASDTESLRQRCFDDARQAVSHAAAHVLRAVLRIEEDAVFAPLLGEPEVQEILQRARAAKG